MIIVIYSVDRHSKELHIREILYIPSLSFFKNDNIRYEKREGHLTTIYIKDRLKLNNLINNKNVNLDDINDDINMKFNNMNEYIDNMNFKPISNEYTNEYEYFKQLKKPTAQSADRIVRRLFSDDPKD